MGLDMYLYKADKKGQYDWREDMMGYWRKANHIHKWFVDNVQNGVDDCKTYPVKRTDIEQLRDTCNHVLESITMKKGIIVNGYMFKSGTQIPIVEEGQYVVDSTVAEALLPTTNRSFFGGTDYDEYYVDDVKHTVNILNEILASFDFESHQLLYRSSW